MTTPSPAPARPDPERRTAPLVLVVEDEESFADALMIGLAREGFEVEVAVDGPSALVRFAELAPDVVLLDVMLPGLSGVDVCRRLRAQSRVPIIMVSARDSEIDTVVGLVGGADDYVAKPFRLRELVARVRAVLRRAAGEDAGPAATDGDGDGGHAGGNGGGTWSSTGSGRGDHRGDHRGDDGRLVAAGIVVDVDRREVEVDGQPVTLPRKEFDLLALLVANSGRVLTRDRLIERVWGFDYVGDTKTLDVHVKRLRAKIEPDPGHPARLVTVRGVGYKLVAG